MGNEQSNTSGNPRRIIDCVYEDGSIDPTSYLMYQRSERQKRRKLDFQRVFEEALSLANKESVEEHTANRQEHQKDKYKRTSKAQSASVHRNSEGEIVPMTWKDSSWYTLYVNPENIERNLQNKLFREKFRRRFRMPYESYTDLAVQLKDSSMFQRWTGMDACGTHASPVELLLLGSLRYLGRGWTFDDIEESTVISREVHRNFFHVFIDWGSTVLFDKYVIAPSNADEAKIHEKEMALAGFPGSVGSGDATHVGMEKCSSWCSVNHSGPKLPMPSRTYNIVVNHRRRILSTTSGHPARWNDKTLQLFDKFMKGLYSGKNLSDFTFFLQERDASGKIHLAKYKGCWILVDNGYIHWATCMPPYKLHVKHSEIRWSKWLESMRKDVECTFGILKGRFRILKSGIRTHGVETCDKIWHTCCALHNLLLEVDGLEEGWEEGIPSSYQGEMGLHDVGLSETNLAVSRLFTPDQFMTFDASGMGPGNDVHDGCVVNEQVQELAFTHGGKTFAVGCEDERVVRELDFEYFRSRLVEHFDILFWQGKVVWPKRTGEAQAVI